MGRLVKISTGWAALAAVLLGCDNLNDYSTKHGECYRGEIVDAKFVRSEHFEAGVTMLLTLDVDAFNDGAGVGAFITTDDGQFAGAAVRQMEELTRDQLSLLSFPSGRVRSYLAFAPASDGRVVNVVVSLMENGDVEVRVFRPEADPDRSLFGVFRLTRKKQCDSQGAQR
jgi:hypothetical protein